MVLINQRTVVKIASDSESIVCALEQEISAVWLKSDGPVMVGWGGQTATATKVLQDLFYPIGLVTVYVMNLSATLLGVSNY